MRLEAAHLGDLLRISVRTGAKTPRGPLSNFQGSRGDHGHRRSERCSSRSRPYLPASGFQGRTTLTEKRELFPDPPATSSSSFRLPGRGTRQRRRSDAARLRAPNTRERFRAGFRNTDRIPFRPKTRSSRIAICARAIKNGVYRYSLSRATRCVYTYLYPVYRGTRTRSTTVRACVYVMTRRSYAPTDRPTDKRRRQQHADRAIATVFAKAKIRLGSG